MSMSAESNFDIVVDVDLDDDVDDEDVIGVELFVLGSRNRHVKFISREFKRNTF